MPRAMSSWSAGIDPFESATRGVCASCMGPCRELLPLRTSDVRLKSMSFWLKAAPCTCITRGRDSGVALGTIPGGFLVQHVNEVSNSFRYCHVSNMMIRIVFV